MRIHYSALLDHSEEMKSVVKRCNRLLNVLFDHQCFFSWSLWLINFLLVSSNIHKELCNFVSILTWRWNFDRSCPIEVEMAKSKCKMLNLDLSQTWIILWHEEMCWKHTTLSCWWGCQKEIKLFTLWSMLFNQSFINYAARWRIMQLAFVVFEEKSLRNPFVDNDNSNLWFFRNFFIQFVNCCFKLWNFLSQYLVSLSITNPISVYDKVCWKLFLIQFCKL